MLSHYFGGKSFLGKWVKLFYPHSKIRFYPPQFIIRNPMASCVRDSFQQGYEVALIVFNIQDLQEFYEKIGLDFYVKYIDRLKLTFKQVVQAHVDEEDIIILHDYNSDGLALIMQVENNKKSLAEIDILSQLILTEAIEKLTKAYPDIKIDLNTGYMFVEKKQYSIEEALSKAHQQALAMAEKKVHSEFNRMMHTMNDIVMTRNIRLLAQPIFKVATREIEAYEVLTRGPAGTELESPLQLFSVARQTNLLYDLELIVFEKTLEKISQNESQQNVFINFTPITLGNRRLIDDIEKMLTKYKTISALKIVIEITERDSIEDAVIFTKNIKILRSMGFRIALDDTGAGYASLHSICEIMPDIIKIDRSVIQNIDTNTVKESMLKGLLLIAKEAGSIVVAEGIESAGEAMVLSNNNVDLAQGYYYARPATMERIPVSS